MYKVIKQKIINGSVVDDTVLVVATESKAKELVQYFRQKENNQLCYYREFN